MYRIIVGESMVIANVVVVGAYLLGGWHVHGSLPQSSSLEDAAQPHGRVVLLAGPVALPALAGIICKHVDSCRYIDRLHARFDRFS